MGVRRRGRECALQLLYQLEACAELPEPEVIGEDVIYRGPLLSHVDGERVDAALTVFFENFDAPDNVHKHTATLVHGVVENAEKIGAMIQEQSASWRLDRMPMVDRNVLRLAVYEMCFGEKIAAKVAVDEAIEVARRYGNTKSAPFVNGVLDALARKQGLFT